MVFKILFLEVLDYTGRLMDKRLTEAVIKGRDLFR